MSDYSDRIAALPPEKRALLLQRLRQKQEQKAREAQIHPVAEGKPFYTASFAQERFWFLAQLNPGGVLNSISTAIRIIGSVNVQALERSFNVIVQRHKVLRTVFTIHEGHVVQKIKPVLSIKLPIIDLSGLPEEEQETYSEKLAKEEANRPFDLTIGPMIRFILLQRAEDYLLIFHVHHIVSDDWSTGVFVRELNELYDAFTNGVSAQLPNLPIQYIDYANWEREQLNSEHLRNQLAYWSKQLEGKLPLLNLPIDFPRPSIRTYGGGRQTCQLSSLLLKAVKDTGQQEGATLYMTLLTAFKILLYRYSNQTDILIGTPFANRNRVELQNLLGCFINTLVLRTNLRGKPTFRQVLAQVRKVTLEAYANADVPFGKLVDTLQPARDLSRTPLFQVMCVMQDPIAARESRPGHALEVWDINDDISEFDLTLLFHETVNGLTVTVVYNTDLFRANTMKRLLEHFTVLLQGAVQAPDQPITSLPLLTAVEQSQQREWANIGTDSVYFADRCLHHLVEQRVEEMPAAAALSSENKIVTYQELDRRANQLAHMLQKCGVGPEVLVGLCIDRSIDMVVGMLGILKAGGAYVPLDPSYPAERLHFILSDTRMPLLLGHRQSIQKLGELPINTLFLDEEWPKIAINSSERPASLVRADNAAYVIYTSGTTGMPKGVVITHRGICNLVQEQILVFQLGWQSRVLQFASLSFDASVSEIFTTLGAGATLVVVSQDSLLPGKDLIKTMQDEHITTITLPPSVLAVHSPRAFPDLQTIISAGERCNGDIVARWADNCRLLNAYGPTESTICATISDALQSAQSNPPIGRPLAHTQVHLLDSHGENVPLGIPGEIYVGGVGVARGYLNRPGLTAERFVPDSFNDQSGARLYKTGDLAKYVSTPNGEQKGDLFFLGRTDQQVKIRGFRIEPQEIEAVLLQFDNVDSAFVTTGTRTDGSLYLVAYLVIKSDYAKDIDESIRYFLKSKLPSYMIPGSFIVLDSFPLNPNGKIDIKSLPQPGQQAAESTKLVAGPRNAIEETLVEIWATVLNHQQVSIYDNFFELGGDSILSLQVISKANEMGLPIISKQIFQYQTIATLAQKIELLAKSSFVAEQGMITGAAPLTPIQHWFFEHSFAAQHHWNNIALLKVPVDTDIQTLTRVLEHLQTHHDAFRLRFTQEDGIWGQKHLASAGELNLEYIDLLALSPPAKKHTIMEEAKRLHGSLDLEDGPLLKAGFFLIEPDVAYLLIVIHHLVFDGVSLRLLISDLITAYQQAAKNGSIRLPAKTTSFKYWGEQLVRYAHTESIKLELPFWLNQTLSKDWTIPHDFKGGDNNEGSAAAVSVKLTDAETQFLLQELPGIYHARINEILLTPLLQTITTWTGENQVLLDLEAHGREEELIDQVNLSRTIGWFTASYPVLFEVDNRESATGIMRAIKNQLRQVPHRGIGYGLLRYICREPALQSQVAAPFSFNYLGQFTPNTTSSEFIPLPIDPVSTIWGPTRNHLNQRPYLIEIICAVIDNQLSFTWSYSQNFHREKTILDLADRCLANLRFLIKTDKTHTAEAYIPSDFPLTQLDQKKLGQIFKKLNQT